MSMHSEKSKEDEPELARNETRVIFWMKFVALVCLIAAGIGMAWLTYALSREQESASFEAAFNDQASRLIDAFYSNTINQMWIASTMGLAISSQEGTFPYVTVPKLEAIGFGQLQLVRGASFTWAPLLHNQTEKRIWEGYAAKNQEAAGYARQAEFDPYPGLDWPGRDVGDGIFEFYNGNWPAKRQGDGPYSPVWQIAPIAKTRRAVMFDQFSEAIRTKGLEQMMELQRPVLSSFLDAEFEQKITNDFQGPRSILFLPLLFEERLVGSVQIEHEWKRVFESVSEESFTVVLSNTCGETASFQTNGPTVTYLGADDWHVPTRGERKKSSSNAELQRSLLSFFADVNDAPIEQFEFFFNDGYTTHDSFGRELCRYSIDVYAAKGFEEQFFTSKPAKYAVVVSFVFVFCVMVFIAYNHVVERRQRKILDNLVRSKAVINSLFPPTFRDRLFTPKRRKESREESRFLKAVASPKLRLTSILNDDATMYPDSSNSREEPIAELFSNTTVIFADIAGFSAWSSQREPYQVFKLLETLYAAFDSVAKSLAVFKVETIGDCYVAVTGLPTPQEDHAILMARFAVQILAKMGELTKDLEISLGPGTADLGLRIGLHSGTVTAGVLRGEKSRFQLFGDTMNVSSRMESTGTPGKVQISQETADLIVAARKGHWLVKRHTAVEAKGIGLLQTYWLNPDEMKIEGTLSSIKELDEVHATDALVPAKESQKWGDLGLESSITARKLERLVDWNVEVLLSFLAKIVESRKDDETIATWGESTLHTASETSSIVSEVTEVIQLPPYTRQRPRGSRLKKDTMSLAVRSQLRDFVFRIASGYRDVPFHNFEHASHVALSANKLMKRIINPDEVGNNQSNEKKKGTNKGKIEAYASDLHDSTFGISSDPLTQFSIVFAALVHDVEHYGVPNSQLVKEQHQIAVKYSNKSVAEKHSVDLALAILSEPAYRDLQACICYSEGERLRFRQLLINSVLATDIVDQELRLLRKNRWTKAFSEPTQTLESNEDVNRKATIVLEHIIQASDVAHTMQHWHIFCKWNEKLYHEMYIAYLDGRAEKDPSDGWYEGEIGFFDFYIIPLARNLKDCGVFGVSSDEYLMYALANRDEWKAKGKSITARMVARKDEIALSRGRRAPTDAEGPRD